MQTARILQAVSLMLIVAFAASCAATKEYTSKIFPTKTMEKEDSQAVALRFLELDKLDPDQENWVSTDAIMGRDTGSKTTALDKLTEVFPATPKKSEPAPVIESDGKPVYVNAAPNPANKIEKKQPAKETDKSSVVKKEVKNPVTDNKETKEETVPEQPVARHYNTGDVREKRSREDRP